VYIEREREREKEKENKIKREANDKNMGLFF
jgi:hypothetical protein